MQNTTNARAENEKEGNGNSSGSRYVWVWSTYLHVGAWIKVQKLFLKEMKRFPKKKAADNDILRAPQYIAINVLLFVFHVREWGETSVAEIVHIENRSWGIKKSPKVMYICFP